MSFRFPLLSICSRTLLTIITFNCICFKLNAASHQVLHQFVCIDNGNNILIHVDQFSPENSWTSPLPKGCRDLQLITENSILVSHSNGAREYSLATGKPLTWKIEGYKKIQSVHRLDSGNTVLLSQEGTIYLVDKDGKEISRNSINKPKLDLRFIRPLKPNKWIISAKNPKAILITETSGSIQETIPLPGKGYKTEFLENGNFLASTGDECKIIEISTQGKILNYYGGKLEHPTVNLDFYSGWSRLPNKNIIACNWLGHNKHGTAMHLHEFTEDNKIIWSWGDHGLAKQITNVLVIR